MKLYLLVFIGIIVLFTSCEKEYKSAHDVVEAMYEVGHSGKWYKCIKYDQKLQFFNADSVVKTSNWKQLVLAPNYMQIRYENFDSYNGSIYRNDSVYDFQQGYESNARYFVHYILLLTSDIYYNSVKKSLYKLKDFGIDLTKINTTSWKNREVIIIGSNDLTNISSSQVWIDKENLYVVRTILNVGGRVQDTEFTDYQQFENYWVPTKLIFKSNGFTVIEMENYNISFPTAIDQSYFVLQNFKTLDWTK